MAGQTARGLALQVLQDVFSGGAYANLSLAKHLAKSELSQLDRRFATELVYGAVRACGTLDWMLSHYIKRPLSQADPLVANILRLGMYQLFFLTKVPASAAVNEAVNLARQLSHPGAGGFVNAVLRSALRNPEKIHYPSLLDDPVRHIALRECHPEWLVKRWIAKIGSEETLALCHFNNTQPPLSLRANTLRTTRDMLLQTMRQSGVEAVASTLTPDGILCQRSGDEPLRFLREGLCQAQDESSMLVAYVVDPQPGEFIIDACAAPGGKSTHLAAQMQNRGRILSCDIHPHKINLIEENRRRLGATIIEACRQDAASLHEQFANQADRVLVDAPCSGLGVLRRRPDLRWRREKALGELPILQQAILRSSAQCVRPGGVLVYSTCTLEDDENIGVVNNFLAASPHFSLESAGMLLPVKRTETVLTLWPQRDGVDGFFIARLRRNA